MATAKPMFSAWLVPATLIPKTSPSRVTLLIGRQHVGRGGCQERPSWLIEPTAACPCQSSEEHLLAAALRRSSSVFRHSPSEAGAPGDRLKISPEFRVHAQPALVDPGALGRPAGDPAVMGDDYHCLATLGP